MPTTFNWIYLGSSGTQIDPTEGNGTSENTAALNGQTFGSSGTPLFGRIVAATTIDNGGTAGVLDTDNNTVNDQFTTNIGAGSVTLTFDGAGEYNATITYADGTTATVTAIIAQDTGGNLFLAPETSANADTTAYEAKPIRSITLNSVVNATLNLTASRQVTAWDDGYIEGTGGDDSIGSAYVEPVGNGSDKIDNNDAGLLGSTGNDDYVRAGAGNDTVQSGAGNDTVEGGTGLDSIDGGTGNDSIDGGNDNDSIGGGDGNDTLKGGAGNDTLLGGNDNDSIEGGDGNNLIDGGAGADVILYGAGNNTVLGGDGNDFIDDGYGVQLTGADSLSGGAGNDTFYSGGGNDTLSGDDGNDQLYGEGDNDTLLGGAGLDTLLGSTGNDSLDGGADADWLYGEQGVDTLLGGAGADTLSGGTEGDYLDGGTENDSLSGDAGVDTLLGGAGADTLYGGVDNDSLDGGADNDLLSGEAGNDTLLGGIGTDSLFGGDGTDSLDGGDGADYLQSDAGADTLLGGAGADTLYGGADNDSLDGGADNDVVAGEAGSDTLLGGTGNDNLSGGADNDSLSGGAGADTIDGGAGRDTIIGGSAGDVVSGGETGDDVDRLDLTGLGPLHIIYDPNPENGTVEFRDAQGQVTGTMTFSGIEQVVPCFTAGTMIATPSGNRAVDSLRAGDAVLTADGGVQIIRWVGQRHLSDAELGAAPRLRPVRVPKDALGKGMPSRDLWLSPQHRILIDGYRAQLVSGHDRAFAPARVLFGDPRPEVRRQMGGRQSLFQTQSDRTGNSLTRPAATRTGCARTGFTDTDGMRAADGNRSAETSRGGTSGGGNTGLPDFVRPDPDRAGSLPRVADGTQSGMPPPAAIGERAGQGVTYLHLMLGAHHVLSAEGLACESLSPSLRALSGFAEAHRAELFALFPALRAAPAEGMFPLAAPVLTRAEARCALVS